MAADGGTVELTYRAKVDQLERDMAGVKSKVGRAGDDAGDGFSTRFKSKLNGLSSSVGHIGATIGKGLALGIAGAAVGVGALFKSSIDEAEEARKVGAQTAAVIQSTGGAANVSAGHVANYADKLAGLTGIDDELIASGQNMLLTFTKVRNETGKGNDIFDQGTKAALNMSVALGKDLPGSAMLVGKALNDPIAGMTALTRSGIQFTAQQKDQVKAMVAAGDMLGAQKVILKELETQFGGSAEAAASPLARLKVVWGNLQEELGARFLPVVGAVATVLADKLPGALDAVGRGFQFLVAGFKDPAAVQGPKNFLDVLFIIGAKARGVVDFIRNAFAAGQADTTWLDHLVGGLRAFVGAWQNASDGVTSSGFAGKMEAIAIFVRQNLQPVLIGLGVALALLVGPWFAIGAALVYAYSKFEGFREVVNSVVSTVTSIISGFVDLVTTLWSQFGDQLTAYARGAWTAISGVISGALEVIRGIVQVVTSLIHGDWSGAWEGIKGILSGAVTAILGLLRGGVSMMQAVFSAGLEILDSIVRGAFEGIVGFVASIPGRIVSALGDLGTLLYNAGRAVVTGLLNGIKDAVGGVYNFVSGIAGKIASLKGPLPKDRRLLEPAGKAIMDGLVAGLRAHEHQLVTQLARVTGLVESVNGTDALSQAAGNYSATFDMTTMGHSAEPAAARSSSGGDARPIQVGPFYGVRQDDLPTDIPRRLRGALHLWS